MPSFIYSLFHTEPYKVISDEIDVVTREYPGDDAAQDVDPRYANGEAVKEPLVELDTEEVIVYEEKGPEALKTLLTGLPSPTSLGLSLLTMAINALLVLMVLDYVYRAALFHQEHDLSMARVGYVSDTTAEILVREPDAKQYPLEFKYRYAGPPVSISNGYQALGSTYKTQGAIDWLTDDTDYTGHMTLTGLRPDTRYMYTVSNNHSGYFSTAPKAGFMPKNMASSDTFTFLHSSCLKPNFPYNPFDHPLSIPGLKYLAEQLPMLRAQFMIFLGDFIYIDVPRRAGESREYYRRDYRQVYASPDWPDVTKELPWIHVYDDHEVANDWDANTTGVFRAAVDPYDHYHTSVNPPRVRPDESYFEFTQGPATFFMLDTRRYRSPNDGTNGTDPITGEATKTMLGQQQLHDLLQWLERPEKPGVRWKFVISSVPFTRNWRFNARDTWAGYLGEREIILEAMWDVGSRGGIGVVVLSGDRHEFAATAFPPPPEGKEIVSGLGLSGVGANGFGLGGSVLGGPAEGILKTAIKKWPQSATVYEFSASPLNMFYLPVHTYMESSTSLDYITDVCIKYLPNGNSKFGAISISSHETSDQSVLHYKLFVDGKETWSYTVTTPPDVPGGGRSMEYRKQHQLAHLREVAGSDKKRLNWD